MVTLTSSCLQNRFVWGSPEFNCCVLLFGLTIEPLSPTTTLASKCTPSEKWQVQWLFVCISSSFDRDRDQAPLNHNCSETNGTKCIWSPLCMRNHAGGNAMGGFTSAVFKQGFPHFPDLLMNPIDFLHLFHLPKHCDIDSMYPSTLFLSHRSLGQSFQITHPTPSPHLFLPSFVKFDVFSVGPSPSQDKLLLSIVLFWQTIISERPGQRDVLFTTISNTFDSAHTSHHPLSGTGPCLCTLN